MTLNIHSTLPRSRANGSGVRYVVWVQGCSLGCAGCFNPETHADAPVRVAEPDALVDEISAADGIEGVTISGGEPLQQMEALIALLRGIRERTSLSVILFTGYAIREIEEMPAASELLTLVDVLIAGRYNASLRVAKGLIGSSNKTLHFLTDRYTRADFASIPVAEIAIGSDGNIIKTGIGWDSV